jgi:hypothetical protein
MAGLLDFEDPNTAGAMQLGLGLLNAGGPSRMPVSLGQGIAQGGTMAMDAMRQARQDLLKKKLAQLEIENGQLTIDQVKKELAKDEELKAAFKSSYQSPEQQALAAGGQGPTNAAAATIPSFAPKLDQKGLMGKLMGIDPVTALKFKEYLEPKMTIVGENQRVLMPDSAAPTGFKTILDSVPKVEKPMSRTRVEGENEIFEEYDQTAKKWNKVSSGPRFAKQIAGGGLSGNLEKPMTALQKQKFETGIANDFKSTGQVMQTMAQLVKAISDVGSSKGLSSREGYSGYLPAWTQGKDAMTAQNRIDTLKGKVTQMGKAMATMSGAIGPMAVQEWKIVADAVNALDPTAGNFKEQIENVQSQAEGASSRIRDWYDRRYSDSFEKYPQFKTESIPLYPTGGGGQSAGGKIGAPAAAQPALSAQEQAELDQLRARFGSKK